MHRHKHSAPGSCSVSLDSDEPLWFWDLKSDNVFLTRGACRALKLDDTCQYTSMSVLLTHVPPAYLPSLNEIREESINGSSGSHLEVEYPFGDVRVREMMLVLLRNKNGRAVRAMGHYEVLPPENLDQSLTWQEEGVWQCRLPEMTTFFNPSAASILGLKSEKSYTLDELSNILHPEDADKLRLQLTLLNAEPHLDGRLDILLRIPRPEGTVRVRLTGSVMERNSEGRPVLLWGSMRRKGSHGGAHARAQNESKRLLFAVNSTGDGMWDWDSTSNNVYFSPLYLAMLGYTAEEFPGQLDVWAQKIHPDDHDKIVYPQHDIVESPRFGDTFECTYRLLRKDGTWAWILGRGYVTHRDENGKATRIVGMHTDITTVQNERERLENLIQNDTLTGLRSRSYLNLETERIDKNHIRPVCAIAADVTGLKMINDLLGHAAGDKLLATTALLLREPLRATDCVARMGGDEFVILLSSCPEERADTIMATLHDCFDRYEKEKGELPIRISLGMAVTADPEVSMAALMRQADRQMLEQKTVTRHEDQVFIHRWIENRLGKSITYADCRMPFHV